MQKCVSLILTTFNCKEDFLKTIQSIESQDYSNIEVCIADGCSIDGTLDEIEKYARTSKHKVVYKSDKDTGIYDGINHAIALSSGDYLEIMNDEYTCTDAITKLVNAIEKEEKSCNCVGSHADIVYMQDGKIRRKWKMGKGSIYSGWLPGHPSLMLKREIYETYGLYDTSYICSADYEFMLRFLKESNELAYVPETLVSMFYGGTSTNSLKSYWVSTTEGIKALWKNHIPFAFFITGMRILRVALQFRNEKKM